MSISIQFDAMSYQNLLMKALLLPVVGGLVAIGPAGAQLEPSSPVAPAQKTPGPTRTLPEILPCDASGRPIGPATKDQIVRVPTPAGDTSNKDVIVPAPPGTPRDQGIVIAPLEDSSGTPGNLPRCTLPAAPKTK